MFLTLSNNFTNEILRSFDTNNMYMNIYNFQTLSVSLCTYVQNSNLLNVSTKNGGQYHGANYVLCYILLLHGTGLRAAKQHGSFELGLPSFIIKLVHIRR